jgi:hypothetical protein
MGWIMLNQTLTVKNIKVYGVVTRRISIRSRVGKGSVGSYNSYKTWSIIDKGTLTVTNNSISFVGNYDLINIKSSQIELIDYTGGWFTSATGVKIHFKGNRNPIIFKVNKKTGKQIIEMMSVQ